MGRTGYIVAAGVAAAAIIGVLMLFNPISRLNGLPSNGSNGTNISSEQPTLQLILLEGPEDASAAVAQYTPNSNETINLQSDAHLRFDSPDARPPDSLRVTAHDLEDGQILILRKSYEVNNEFFVNLEQGKYQLRAEAAWTDNGPFLYTYDIAVA